jgi:hypothetical protein
MAQAVERAGQQLRAPEPPVQLARRHPEENPTDGKHQKAADQQPEER